MDNKSLFDFSNNHYVSPGLAGKVAGFAGFLKSRGFRVFQSSVHDALLSIEETGLSAKEDVAAALRANLSTNDLEWRQFLPIFEEYWNDCDAQSEEKAETKRNDDPGSEREGDITELTEEDSRKGSGGSELNDKDSKEWLEGIAYSPVSNVEKKDLGRFSNEDVRIAELSLKKMMDPFRIQIVRRTRKGKKSGTIDLSRVLKKSMKTDGIPLQLYYREKKKRLKKLVILADVSGSMDRYARFVMPFILGMRGIGARAEVFVFSTRLAYLTFIIRHLSIEKAIARIAEEVPDWSGGTRIGYSLSQFNKRYSSRLINRRAIVVILSDGWDLGGKDILRKEMAELNRKADKIVWLNPLAGDPDFEPICQGMKAALPFVDYLLPVNNLRSLQGVGRLLSRIMAH